MKIGVAGPITTSTLAEFIGLNINRIPEGSGGVSVTQFVKGMLKKGCHVSVYSFDFEITVPVTLKGPLLTLYYGPYRQKHRMRDFMKLERNFIRDAIKQDGPDIVHAHWTYEFALGALASGKPTLITVRDWAPAIFYFIPDAYRFGRLLMAFTSLFKGTHFTANSPYIQRLMKKYLRKDVPVIPNALSDGVFYKGERKLKVNYPIIVSVNNGFGRLKNVKPLIKAHRLVRKDIPACRLMLIGIGYEKNGEAEQWAKIKLLSEGIDFLGSIPYEEVLKILESADLLVHPSLEESFGMTLLEAMAKKVPVIGGTASGAVPWVLNYGKSGVLTDVKSYEIIAGEIVKLLTDMKSWKKYSNSGYQYAMENFALSKVVDQYIGAYKKVLSGRKEQY